MMFLPVLVTGVPLQQSQLLCLPACHPATEPKAQKQKTGSGDPNSAHKGNNLTWFMPS